jgi:hypothetical protein
VEPFNHLAWLLATHPDAKYRDGAEAVRVATRAVQLTKNRNADALDTLAAAYAEEGQFPEAVKSAQEAETLARSDGKPDLAAQIRYRREGYQAHRPARG